MQGWLGGHADSSIANAMQETDIVESEHSTIANGCTSLLEARWSSLARCVGSHSYGSMCPVAPPRPESRWSMT